MKNTVAVAMQVILMGAGFSLPSSNAQTQKEGTPYTIEYHEVSFNNSTGRKHSSRISTGLSIRKWLRAWIGIITGR